VSGSSRSASSAVDKASPWAEFKPPLFIVGSARSGTNLLYDTLLSSGEFANYRTEPVVFDLLVPKFGDLSRRRNRVRLLSVWLRSYQFYLSGLERDFIAPRVLNDCNNAGDFIVLVMNEIARRQGVSRWAVWGPDNLLHMSAIASTIPTAQFIHLIRDGRDVALSLTKKSFIRPFPWDRARAHALVVAGLHWKWKVERGRELSRALKDRYLEVRFEDLVLNPRKTLTQISTFIGRNLDYDLIQRKSIGTLISPNSAYRGPDGKFVSEPVERWRTYLSRPEIAQLESACGPLLGKLGYALEFPARRPQTLALKAMNQLYPTFFSLKEWLRSKTPLGRFVNTNRLRFDAVPR